MKNLLHKLRNTFNPNIIVAIFIASVVAIAGYAILTSRAATIKNSDLNNDGTVSIFDLSIILSKWNQTGTQAADINDDSTVNIFDLSILLSRWGTNGTPPTGSCALPNYPDASCTGVPAGTSLTTQNGDQTINTSGTIIENKLINGCVYINAGVSNVIIRKSKISCNDGGAISNDGTNLLVEDVEIDCNDTLGVTALSWQSYTARRVHAYGCDNTMWAEHNVLIEDSYLHDNIPYDPETDPHTDGIQIPSGATNINIRHNTVYGGYIDQTNFGNAAITTGPNTTNIDITDNLLAGGGYTLYCTHGGPSPNGSVLNNRFSRIFVNSVGGFGPWTECDDENHSGNVYHETGQPVPF